MCTLDWLQVWSWYNEAKVKDIFFYLLFQVISVIKRHPSVQKISNQECHVRKYEGKIAGLEPINFITSATPHLGCRGHKQVIVLDMWYIMFFLLNFVFVVWWNFTANNVISVSFTLAYYTATSDGYWG